MNAMIRYRDSEDNRNLTEIFAKISVLKTFILFMIKFKHLFIYYDKIQAYKDKSIFDTDIFIDVSTSNYH